MVVWGAWFNQTPDRRSRKLEWGSYFRCSSWKGSRNALTSCTLRALEEERRCVQARIQQTCKMTAAAMLNLLWKDEMNKHFFNVSYGCKIPQQRKHLKIHLGCFHTWFAYLVRTRVRLLPPPPAHTGLSSHSFIWARTAVRLRHQASSCLPRCLVTCLEGGKMHNIALCTFIYLRFEPFVLFTKLSA